MGRAEEISSYIKRHDSKLYCEEGREGKLCVFRKSTRVEHYVYEGHAIGFVRPAPYFIFALTDDWTMNGTPVDRGVLPIMVRLREIDLWSRDLAQECISQTERNQESNERELSNNNEAFLKDYRRQFAKTFGDINTSTLSKTCNRKLGEIKNGSNK